MYNVIIVIFQNENQNLYVQIKIVRKKTGGYLKVDVLKPNKTKRLMYNQKEIKEERKKEPKTLEYDTNKT